MSCAKFLHRENYHTLENTRYAKCDRCGTHTCTTCKIVILPEHDCANRGCNTCKASLIPVITAHKCQIAEDDKLFKKVADEEGFKECFGCGSTVELSEACNHMT